MPRPFLLLVLLALFATNQLKAQETVGIRIAALSSAERDALVQQLADDDELYVAFACVPAGILVIGSRTGATTRATLRTQAVSALQPVLAAARIGEEDLTLQAAEAACENARGE